MCRVPRLPHSNPTQPTSRTNQYPIVSAGERKSDTTRQRVQSEARVGPENIEMLSTFDVSSPAVDIFDVDVALALVHLETDLHLAFCHELFCDGSSVVKRFGNRWAVDGNTESKPLTVRSFLVEQIRANKHPHAHVVWLSRPCRRLRYSKPPRCHPKIFFGQSKTTSSLTSKVPSRIGFGRTQRVEIRGPRFVEPFTMGNRKASQAASRCRVIGLPSQIVSNVRYTSYVGFTDITRG